MGQEQKPSGGRPDLKTVKGYDFFQCSSAMQKAIRRGDARIAGYFALELWKSNYATYVWKRLLTVSAEDCWGILTQEVEALYRSWELINKNQKEPKGRIFISKAVILLCLSKKSRDADHLQNIIYDKEIGIGADDILGALEESGDYIEIPDYALDVHTMAGRKRGATKAQFFHDEQEGLKPHQVGLFDDLIEEAFPNRQEKPQTRKGHYG
jgi:replication-associated recombination protein RarA